MKREEIIELLEAVDNINADLYNQCTTTNKHGHDKTDPWVWMEVLYGSGGELVIEFLREIVYESQNDGREWVEESGSVGTDDLIYAHYEPIEPWLREQANQLLSKLQKIKL